MRQECYEYRTWQVIDTHRKEGFEDGWAIVGNRFTMLQDFCEGIATAFPNTAAVESDFSVLGWEKDEYRLKLSDLSLEGILQSKQFYLLTLLAAQPYILYQAIQLALCQ